MITSSGVPTIAWLRKGEHVLTPHFAERLLEMAAEPIEPEDDEQDS